MYVFCFCTQSTGCTGFDQNALNVQCTQWLDTICGLGRLGKPPTLATYATMLPRHRLAGKLQTSHVLAARKPIRHQASLTGINNNKRHESTRAFISSVRLHHPHHPPRGQASAEAHSIPPQTKPYGPLPLPRSMNIPEGTPPSW